MVIYSNKYTRFVCGLIVGFALMSGQNAFSMNAFRESIKENKLQIDEDGYTRTLNTIQRFDDASKNQIAQALTTLAQTADVTEADLNNAVDLVVDALVVNTNLPGRATEIQAWAAGEKTRLHGVRAHAAAAERAAAERAAAERAAAAPAAHAAGEAGKARRVTFAEEPKATPANKQQSVPVDQRVQQKRSLMQTLGRISCFVVSSAMIACISLWMWHLLATSQSAPALLPAPVEIPCQDGCGVPAGQDVTLKLLAEGAARVAANVTEVLAPAEGSFLGDVARCFWNSADCIAKS